jgi:hypothetical protein
MTKRIRSPLGDGSSFAVLQNQPYSCGWELESSSTLNENTNFETASDQGLNGQNSGTATDSTTKITAVNIPPTFR